MAADEAALGRRIADAQGFDPTDPSVDWVAYGRAAAYAISKRRGVLSPREFARHGAELAPPTRRAAPSAHEPPARHVVQIGGFQIRRADPRTTARQHPRRQGERTTGRYRTRHADTPHRHGHGGR